MDTRDTRVTEIRHGGPFKRCLDISWGAVFAGWLVAAAAAMVLYALGAAGGISVIRLTDAAVDEKMVISAVIWLIITWTVACGLGGYYAASISRTVDKKVGCSQGIAVWALSIILTIFVGVTGLAGTGLAGVGMVNAVGQIGGGFIAAQDDDAAYTNPISFQSALKQRLGVVLPQSLKAETLTEVSREFISGDKASAKNTLLLNTSLTDQEAEAVVNDMSQRTEQVKQQVKVIADHIAHYTSCAFWLSVLIALLSLASAAGAGRVGIREYLETNCTVTKEERI